MLTQAIFADQDQTFQSVAMYGHLSPLLDSYSLVNNDWKGSPCVCLTMRAVCTFRSVCALWSIRVNLLGRLAILAWGQIFKLNFRSRQLVYSTRLDEKNTNVLSSFVFIGINRWKVIRKKYHFGKKQSFFLFMPLKVIHVTSNVKERRYWPVSNFI